MKYRYRGNIGDKATVGATIGAITGGLAATVGTIWGGYELGTIINDHFDIYNSIARGALDLIVMGFMVAPAFTIGIYGGMTIGGALGATSHPLIEGYKDILDKAREIRSNIRRKRITRDYQRHIERE